MQQDCEVVREDVRATHALVVHVSGATDII
jgi:hypothetical protein